MQVWTQDGCSAFNPDNGLFTENIPSLPSDLDDNACKLTVKAHVPGVSKPHVLRGCAATPNLHVPTLDFLYPTECLVHVFGDNDFSEPLLTVNTSNPDGEEFTLPAEVQNEFSSFKMVGNCKQVKLWEKDSCAENALDNIMFVSNAATLPSDLDDDVCKMTVYANRAKGASLT